MQVGSTEGRAGRWEDVSVGLMTKKKYVTSRCEKVIIFVFQKICTPSPINSKQKANARKFEHHKIFFK